MKSICGFLYLSFFLVLTLISCEDNIQSGDEKTQLNKILININGKDSVMDIWKMELINRPASSYPPYKPTQQLSVISSQDGTGFHLDFYINDTTLQLNKEYPVTRSVATTMYETAVYFRNFNMSAYPGEGTIYDTNGNYYSKITYLTDNEIKGVFRFLYGNTILVTGTFHSDQLVRK